MSSFHRRRVNRAGPDFLDAYSVRIMIGLAISLGVLVLCVRLPAHRLPAEVGWGPRPSPSLIALKDVREEKEQDTRGDAGLGEKEAAPRDPLGAPVTSFSAAGAGIERGDSSGGEGEQEPEGSSGAEEETPSEKSPLAERAGVFQMHTLDQKPHAIGGIGGVYLKIDYPEQARRDSIQGRLTLRFIVEKDGATSHVRVTEPLHPLCDSAAVRAVERTRFMAGRRGGKAVRVAMQLPVRFQLLDREQPALQASHRSPGSSGAQR